MKYAACVFITFDNKVLAVSRKDDPTKFGLPGGKVDPADGERLGGALKAAAIRELREETGVDLSGNQKSLEPFFVRVDEIGFVTYTFIFRGKRALVNPTQQPHEGKVEWVTWDTMFEGPFGSYNKDLFQHYAMQFLYTLD
jgi:8-oxo-dGTP pyrophosphatase MutT (NUDIX family)